MAATHPADDTSGAAVAAASGGNGNGGGFSVLIVACGPLAMGGVVYAVHIAQQVQSWTVLRSHDDFKALSDALAPVLRTSEGTLPGGQSDTIIPEFPSAPEQSGAMVRVRNSLQLWLSAMLMIPNVRESAAIRQFLTIGANTIPHQYEGVAWTQFTQVPQPPAVPSPPDNRPSLGAPSINIAIPGGGATGGVHGSPPSHSPLSSPHQQHALNNDPSPHAQPQNSNSSQLDMEMDYMFHHNDHDHFHQVEDEDGVDEDDPDYIPSAAVRYKPTEEPVADEDEMDIMQYAGEVEMIDDIGSLAQSLGASHLGTSLQLQAERNHKLAGQGGMSGSADRNEVQGGITMGAAPSQRVISGGGGLGSAMADALNNNSYITQHNHLQQPQRPMANAAPRLDNFKMLKVIGKGSFGKVFLVRENKSGEVYALKVLRKDNIIKRNQIEHTKTERNVLGYVKHPFIVGMNMAFQSKDKLYFVLDYCAGGELFFHLGKLGRFPEARARFYAAEIVLAISYVHSLDIVYRDLKPENVLIDDKGHIRLTDFGLSKEGISSSSSGANSFCGTPEYLAPEILNRQGHGRAVDWWSLGALLYEMLTGLPPFYCQDRERLFEKIRKSELNYPATVQPAARSLLKGLLTKDPTRRLGSGPDDAEEIKIHEFFVPIQWDRLVRGEIQPEWIPKIQNTLDTSQFDKEFTNMPILSPQSTQRGVHGFGTTPGTADNPFEGFTFTDHVFHGPPVARTRGTE